MSTKGKKGAVRSIVEKVFGAAEKQAPTPVAQFSPAPTPGSKTFTIPEKPLFTLPDGVYDEVEQKAARWHALKHEIAESGEKERRKQEKLEMLAEREIRDGVSLEEEMDRLQAEIDEIRKARDRAQMRLEPTLRAAWAAALAARERVWARTREYERKRDAYVQVLSEMMEFVQKASEGLPAGIELRTSEYDRHHVEERFGLPHVSPEFSRGEPERDPPKPPTGVVEYVPPPVVTHLDSEPRRPIQPATPEDVERLSDAAKAEDDSDDESDEPADLLASVRSALEGAADGDNDDV